MCDIRDKLQKTILLRNRILKNTVKVLFGKNASWSPTVMRGNFGDGAFFWMNTAQP